MGFYREDLKLENKWWHRLMKFVFGGIMILAIIILFIALKPGKLIIDNTKYFKVTSTILDKKLPGKNESWVTLNDLKSKSETRVKACRGDKKGDIVTFKSTQLFDDDVVVYCKAERTKNDLNKLSKQLNNAIYKRRLDGTIVKKYNTVYDIIGYQTTAYICFRNFEEFSYEKGNWLVDERLITHEENDFVNSMSRECFYSPYNQNSPTVRYIKYGFKWIWRIILIIFWELVIGFILQLIYYKGIIYIIYGNTKNKRNN